MVLARPFLCEIVLFSLITKSFAGSYFETVQISHSSSNFHQVSIHRCFLVIIVTIIKWFPSWMKFLHSLLQNATETKSFLFSGFISLYQFRRMHSYSIQWTIIIYHHLFWFFSSRPYSAPVGRRTASSSYSLCCFDRSSSFSAYFLIFWHTTCFRFILYLPCPRALKSAISPTNPGSCQGKLPFSGEQHLETKTEILDMLIAFGVSLLPGPLSKHGLKICHAYMYSHMHVYMNIHLYIYI